MKRTYTPRWTRRKLTFADGDRILWHAVEHLRGIIHDVDQSEISALRTLYTLLEYTDRQIIRMLNLAKHGKSEAQ